ncbi:hypothetical protein [uncultured Psychroserpens sp.]|uniref:hypothetical protein n=1 Tax=uncultured Psychroserpens sp. TaxID=255436 RepID=UPI0026267617|nr:hypothetical protein [uncultured Psychroserpens sp.]
MSEKKHIDKLFKEQLKDFEVAPKDHVWEHIERKLHQDKRKKRRVIPIWWQIAGVAAVLALLFTVGNTFFNNNTQNSTDTEIVDTEKSDTKTSKDLDSTTKTNISDTHTSKNKKSSVAEQNTSEDSTDSVSENDLTTTESSNKNNTVVSSDNSDNKDDNGHHDNKEDQKKQSIIRNKSQQKNAVVNNESSFPKDKKDTPNTNTAQNNAVATQTNKDKSNTNDIQNDINKEQSEIDKLIKDTKQGNNTKIATSNTSEKDNATSVIDSTKANNLIKDKNAIDEAIAEAEKNKDSTTDESLKKRWSLAPNVAPVYFNTLGKGSSLDNQFVDNEKEGSVNVSYGIRGSYAINKKLKIRAGVNKVDLGYSTNNIFVFDGTSGSGARMPMQNVKLHDTLNTNSYVSADNFSFTTGPQFLFTKEQGSIDQQLGFIEVPIELEYSLIDKKFGLNLIGGFSTLFLSNNEIYSVQSNGDRTFLGEATNIKDMSYSANFGIGVNYNISKQLRFNLEPTFKYQINTFSDTSGDFQPFFIGVYTGLSFKF